MQCTVLNASHEPLSVGSPEEGLLLLLKDKAIVLHEHPERKFRTVRGDYPYPVVVVLKEWRKTGSQYYKAAPLNQRNLFIRDDYTCQYCQRYFPHMKRKEYLTRDHVLPQSRGGTDTWDNVVTSCSTCNHSKDDRTPAEFLEQVTSILDTVEEQLARTTSAKAKQQLQERVAYLSSIRQFTPDLVKRKLRAPTVAEVQAKRKKRVERELAK